MGLTTIVVHVGDNCALYRVMAALVPAIHVCHRIRRRPRHDFTTFADWSL